MQTVLKIEGMTCNHCKMSVEKALKGINGVESAEVDLAKKEAVVTGSVGYDDLAKVVETAGYKVTKDGGHKGGHCCG